MVASISLNYSAVYIKGSPKDTAVMPADMCHLFRNLVYGYTLYFHLEWL